MRNFVQEGCTLTVAAPTGGVSSGDGVKVGNIFGIAVTNAAEAADVAIETEGIFDMPKTGGGGITFGLGSIVYFDSTTKLCTSDSSKFPIGLCVVAAVDADTTVRVGIGMAGVVAALVVTGAVLNSAFTAAGDLLIGTGSGTKEVVNLAEDYVLVNDGTNKRVQMTASSILARLASGHTKACSVGEIQTLLAAVIKTGLALNDVLVGTGPNAQGVVNMGVSTIFARLAAGDAKACSVPEILTLLGVEAGADVTDPANVDTAAANLLSSAHLKVLTAKIGIPFLIKVDCSAAVTDVAVFNADCPHKIQLIDSFAKCTGANAMGTLKLRTAATGSGADITDAMTCAVEHAIGRAGSLNEAAGLIAAGASLYVQKAAGDQGFINIWAVRVA